MPASSRPAVGRSWFDKSQLPFVGMARGYLPTEFTPGTFSLLQNVDVSPTSISTRKDMALLFPQSGAPVSFYGATTGCLWASDGDYFLALRAAGSLSYRQIGYVPTSGDGWKTLVLSRDGSKPCQFVRVGDEIILFHPDGNLVLSSNGSGTLVSRPLGITRQAYFESFAYNGLTNPGYRLYRYGIDCVRTASGIPVNSSSIWRLPTDAKFYTDCVGEFAIPATIGFDAIRIWRSKQLNISETSSNNVLVGSPDELYLLCTIPLSSIPDTGTLVIGAVEISKVSAGIYRMQDATEDIALDDTTLQGIESINLDPIPASPCGALVGARFWVGHNDGLAYSNPQGTLWRELFDPLNAFDLQRPVTGICEHFGDLMATSISETWRVAGGNPESGTQHIASWGCASARRMARAQGVGLFAVNQDNELRLLNSSMTWVDSIGGIPFSKQLGPVTASNGQLNVVLCAGNLYVSSTNSIMRLNLADGCGWSEYRVDGQYLSYAFLYAGGASVGFCDAFKMRGFALSGNTGYDASNDAGVMVTTIVKIDTVLAAVEGFLELWSVECYAKAMGAPELTCTVQGRPWTDASGSFNPPISGEFERILLTAPRATAYKSRPVGRYLCASLYFYGLVNMIDLKLQGIAQSYARPGWSPFNVFGAP